MSGSSFIFLCAVIQKSACDFDVVLNILLTLLGWIPGIIHAFYVILKVPG